MALEQVKALTVGAVDSVCTMMIRRRENQHIQITCERVAPEVNEHNQHAHSRIHNRSGESRASKKWAKLSNVVGATKVFAAARPGAASSGGGVYNYEQGNWRGGAGRVSSTGRASSAADTVFSPGSPTSFSLEEYVRLRRSQGSP